MPIFSKKRLIAHELDAEISNSLVRLLASEAERLGVTPPPLLSSDFEPPARLRYAPMQRLLTQDDEHFLWRQGVPGAALKIRREHRRLYREFLANLRRDIRQARRLQGLAMASAGKWDFWSLLAQVVLSESSLLYLGWLGWKHSAGISLAARDVRECLDFLLARPRFPVAAT